RNPSRGSSGLVHNAATNVPRACLRNGRGCSLSTTLRTTPASRALTAVSNPASASASFIPFTRSRSSPSGDPTTATPPAVGGAATGGRKRVLTPATFVLERPDG